MKFSILIIIALIVIALYWGSSYNGIINKRNKVQQAFSGIDIQLKKRWDLIPQLVEAVKGYAKHESDLLERVVNARNNATHSAGCSHARFENEGIISAQTPQILSLAEGYPDLKADKQFIWLQRNLTEVEAQISASRRAYNASVLSYNNALQLFPSSIIAKKHGFVAMDFFSVDQTERQNVSIWR